MPSSTSSSEALAAGSAGLLRTPPGEASGASAGTDRYARQTAADRPGVAQPVPVRPVPEQPWGKILIGMLALLLLASR